MKQSNGLTGCAAVVPGLIRMGLVSNYDTSASASITAGFLRTDLSGGHPRL
jgi:hypothetical protein